MKVGHYYNFDIIATVGNSIVIVGMDAVMEVKDFEVI